MTFENLVFITHPSTNAGIMAKYRFNSGKVLSVIAGRNFYSESTLGGIRGDVRDVSEAVSFEVMLGDDDPIGWQSREDINKIIKENE